MSFVSLAFLTALVAAGGPTLIHLLHRRRYRTVHWAATQLLRQAVRRSRRVIEVRDLTLLVLRTLAVALFVLAMAQPRFTSLLSFWVVLVGSLVGAVGLVTLFFGIEHRSKRPAVGGLLITLSGTAIVVWQTIGAPPQPLPHRDAHLPVHAVIVIDNSLSMGYQQLRTQFDEARDKARAFIETLPAGSQVSIIPMCRQTDWHAQDVYEAKEDAIEAIDRIELLDRAGYAADGAEVAAQAVKQVGTLTAKRVVFIGDMQRSAWATSDLAERLSSFGAVQVAHVGPDERSNTWIESFRLRDGIASPDAPAVFTATIRHQGPRRRDNVDVTLTIGDHVLPSQRVDLLPDQRLQVTFEYRFRAAGTSNEPLFVPARIELTPDRLPEDDFRVAIVPVASQVPVLFVDQLGPDERPALNRYGDTYPLRRLLASRDGSGDAARGMVAMRHRSMIQVTRDELRDTRLVVIAAVTAPTESFVQLMREYVEQGGQLLIAPGADFDPARWDETAWHGGAGVLAAPLRPVVIGALGQTNEVRPLDVFRLAADTMKDPLFDLSLPAHEAESVYQTPLFFKAVAVDEERFAAFDDAERARIGLLNSEEERPHWITWSNPLAIDDQRLTIDQRVAFARPRVMGRYDNGAAFAVRRRIGWGESVLLTSSVFPSWNSIAVDNSVILFDQLMRAMLTRSLPSRTLEAVNEVIIPIAARDQGASFTMHRPGDTKPQPISIEAIGGSTYGVVLRSVGRRGVYEIRRQAVNDLNSDTWSLLLAINGDASESELAAVTADELRERQHVAGLTFVPDGQPLSISGPSPITHAAWRWLLAASLACLVCEMICLSPAVSRFMNAQLLTRERGGAAA